MAAVLARLRATRAALTRVPGPKDWGLAVILLAGFLVLAALIGVPSRLLAFSPPARFDLVTVGVILGVLIQPAILQEVIWRGLLLPPPDTIRSRRSLVIVALVLVAFVLEHPIEARILPGRMSTEARPDFLLLAGLLGLACTVAYVRTRSLWPAIAIHWMAVAAWIVLFGGAARLGISLTAN